MTPYFAAGDGIKELVKEPYSKLDERAQEKWTDVLNLLKIGKVNVLSDGSESEILGEERILAKQLQGAGQVVEITVAKDERSVKVAFINVDETSWVIGCVVDDEKKK